MALKKRGVRSDLHFEKNIKMFLCLQVITCREAGTEAEIRAEVQVRELCGPEEDGRGGHWKWLD